MLENKRHIFSPPLRPSVQVTKLPTTFFKFLRVPLTYLDRWLAFFTNPTELYFLTYAPRLTKEYKHTCALYRTRDLVALFWL